MRREVEELQGGAGGREGEWMEIGGGHGGGEMGKGGWGLSDVERRT